MTDRRGPTRNSKALHAYVSDDAHKLWHGHAAVLGVSFAALAEVAAFHLDRIVDDTDLVTSMRAIDAARRRRNAHR